MQAPQAQNLSCLLFPGAFQSSETTPGTVHFFFFFNDHIFDTSCHLVDSDPSSMKKEWKLSNLPSCFGLTLDWLWRHRVRCDQHLPSLTLSTADYPPWRGWAPSNQRKALRAMTEVSQRKESSASELRHRNLASFSSLPASLQISDLLVLTIKWKSLSLSPYIFYWFSFPGKPSLI